MALVVNGQRIEDDRIQQEFERLWPDYRRTFKDADSPEMVRQLRDWSKENLVERTILEQQVAKLKCDLPESLIDAQVEKLKIEPGGENSAEVRSVAEMKLKTDLLIERVCKDLPEISEQQVRCYWEENPEAFKQPQRVRAAHIVKHIDFRTDQAAAQEAISQAAGKLCEGIPFEVLAQQYSDCPENGGDLGYISPGQMVEEFDDVVFNLGAGQISDVFRTRYGFHVATVYDIKPQTVEPLEQASPRIIEHLQAQARQEAFEAYLDRLKSQAVIEEI